MGPNGLRSLCLSFVVAIAAQGQPAAPSAPPASPGLLAKIASLPKAALGAAHSPAPGPNANPLADQRAPMLSHLNSLVGWYRQVQGGAGWVMQPAEAFYFSAQRDLTERGLRAAFAAATAEAPLVGDGPASAANGQQQQTQRIATMIGAAEQRMTQLRQQKAALDAQANEPNAPEDIAPRRDVIGAQLNLAQAQIDALQKMASFLSGNGDDAVVGGNLLGQIRALQRSMPEIFGADPTAAPAAPAAAATPATSVSPAGAPVTSSTGLIGRAEAVYNLQRARTALDRLSAHIAGLQQSSKSLREPVRSALVAIVQQSQQLNPQVSAGAGAEQLGQMRRQLDAWTDRYKALSGVLVPYSQEMALLAQSADNVNEWRSSVDRQYSTVLRSLAIKVLILGGALVLLLIVSEIWRRATFRYVHDARRRRQFLLVRRFVTGGLICLLLLLGVVSDLGSLATFAGFITAGIAVALQSVILSVAAYFFLIGRYGVKVGDRVTLSGVTGEVIDIGLVRVYLMELAGTGVDLHPTGRVVVFANSALFSGTAPLYKQIPGTEFAWHELQADLVADADADYVQKQLFAAVCEACETYRPLLEQQHTSVQKLIDVHLELPIPSSSVRLADTGIEVVCRYPVDIRKGSEIDSRVTEKVISVMHGDAKVKAALNGAPRVRVAVKV